MSGSRNDDIKVITSKLGSLVAPLETTFPPQESRHDWFNKLLKSKVDEYYSTLSKEDHDADDADDADVRWSYIKVCLQELGNLKDHLRDDGDNDDDDVASSSLSSSGPLLSVQEQKVITSLIQMMMSLGIVPNLIPGVGLPLEKRSKFSQLINPSDNKLENIEKHRRIVYIIEAIFKLTDDNKYLASMIITKNFGDILAALIQLSYAPLKKPEKRENSPDSFVMTEELYHQLTEQQTSFRGRLHDFINRVYQPLVVKYLLVIQSGGGASNHNNSINDKRPKVPQWLKKIVGELLSSRLMRKNGVLNIIRGVMDIGGEGALDPRKYQVIAGVLASPPSTFSYSKIEDYYAIICPQILSIMNMKDETMEKTYHLIACACIRSITERSLILSRRYFLDPLMEPFYQLCKGSVDGITEEIIEKSIQDLHLIFVVGNDPSIVFINHLEPIILTLLHLHRHITFGVSHLRGLVKDLILRYLKYSTVTHSLSVLRMYGFRYKPIMDGKSRLKYFDDEKIKFVAGDSGGVVAQIKNFSNDEENSTGNFYVEDDEKSIVLSDLVADISKEMTMEFFMSLVNDLTGIMTLGEDDDDSDEPVNLEQAVSNLSINESDGSKFSLTEQKLRQVEADMDRVMNRLRKNLMVIRLLGLMSEDDNLQENLSKNSTRLINFVSMTIHRGAILTEKRKNDQNSPDLGLMEIQSLNMALTILSIHLTQPDVSVSDWTQLQSTLDSLKVLSESYKDERVRRMAAQIRQLIATHGAILKHTDEMKIGAEKITEKTNRINGIIDETKKLNERAKETDASNKTDYQEALYNLSDPLLPIRGHGLITLTRLIGDKDQETMNNLDDVIGIFTTNLEDDDTYIYLSAINGLVAAATYKQNADDILELLTKEFTLDRKCFEKSMEVKTKIGEALVRVVGCLGDLSVKYKNLLLNSFLSQSSHPDDLVRSSSYSNLGELCKNLKFSLGNIVQEVFMNLDATIKFDKSIEVRRSAVMVLTLILQGLGKDSFIVLKDILKDVYKSLKKLERSEIDDAMCFHITSALEEIDKIVKHFFNPDPTMSKTIYVLESPPEPF